MVRTQIQIPDEQAKKLKRLAASRHLSVAELIRQAVDAMIKSSTVIDIEEKRMRARNIVGKFRSGKKEVSNEHDKYLSEVFGKCRFLSGR